MLLGVSRVLSLDLSTVTSIYSTTIMLASLAIGSRRAAFVAFRGAVQSVQPRIAVQYFSMGADDLRKAMDDLGDKVRAKVGI